MPCVCFSISIINSPLINQIDIIFKFKNFISAFGVVDVVIVKCVQVSALNKIPISTDYIEVSRKLFRS